ncbi:MAG: FGGY-family carbohydrate kinase [Lachnospiraceae bacterium]|nr:FGGY-family carbohydrate kinase [Candidatus Equihabitans merdae]
MSAYLVGCDIGTSGTKSVVMNEEGVVLGKHTITYNTLTNSLGWAEHDPEDYWNASADTIKEAIRQSKVDPKDIKGVSVSGQSPACILIDKNLKPLQLSHFWMDRRGVKEAQAIKEIVGEDHVFDVSGNPTDPYYGTVKLLWEKNNRPDLYKEAVKMQNPNDYTRMKLTGKLVTDASNASLTGITFDIVNRKWDTDMIEKIGLDPDKFPEAFACEEIVGEVTAEAAERTGLAKGTPVVAGTVDCNAAWVANGILYDGEMSLAMGSAGVLGVIHKQPKFTKNMITIVHPSVGDPMYSTVAATCSCGALLRYYRDEFADIEAIVADKTGKNLYTYLCERAAKIPVGAEGLITVPYFMGERTPIWEPQARGMMFGMNYSHTKDHMLRSFLEGACLAIKDNFEMMRDTGVNMKTPLVLAEGGAQSPIWRQIVSDVLNVDSVYMADAKAAPEGNAIIAGVGTGVFKDYSVVKDWVKVSDESKPNQENAAKYDEIIKIYRRLYQEVKGEYAELAELVSKLDRM